MHRFAVRTIISSVVFLILIAPTAFAALPNPKGFKAKTKDVFQLFNTSNKKIQCVTYKKKLISGVYKKGYFRPSTYGVLELKEKIRKARKKDLPKLNAQLKKLTKSQKDSDKLCKQGPDPLTPLNRVLTEEEVRYLYEKAAFGAPSAQAFQIGMTQGSNALVDFMMSRVDSSVVDADARRWLDENFTQNTNNVTDRGVHLWAMYLMLNSPNPFHERYALLFLHNLLATSMEVLTDDSQNILMVDHLEKLRANASSGAYIPLLKEITRDPVMLIWLTGNQNTKQQPNENFARELMELFSLSPTDRNGNINYSEQTVAQVARACTGWTVQRLNVGGGVQVWSSVFGEAIHDPDPAKVIFEGTPYQGLVNNDFNVIDHIFAHHPNPDDFLAKRLLGEYLNEHPSIRVQDSAARELRTNGYNFLVLLNKLFKSREFFAAANRNSVVASPTERVVKFLRATNLPYDLNTARGAAENGGQIVSMPPTVFGWDNPEWPTGQWLLASSNSMTNIIRNDGLFNQRSYSFRNLLPHPAATDVETVNHLSRALNVALTPDQMNLTVSYMNNRLNNNNTYAVDMWDPANAAKVRRKVAGLLEILSRSNDFQMR
jgi:uncharacterized protein (DUF1800 family)